MHSINLPRGPQIISYLGAWSWQDSFFPLLLNTGVGRRCLYHDDALISESRIMLNVHKTVLIFNSWNMINISINWHWYYFIIIIILIGQILVCDLVVIWILSIIVAWAGSIVRCKFKKAIILSKVLKCSSKVQTVFYRELIGRFFKVEIIVIFNLCFTSPTLHVTAIQPLAPSEARVSG